MHKHIIILITYLLQMQIRFIDFIYIYTHHTMQIVCHILIQRQIKAYIQCNRQEFFSVNVDM